MPKADGEVEKESSDASAGEKADQKDQKPAADQDGVDYKELLRIERERAEKAERDRDNYKTALSQKKTFRPKAEDDEPEEEDGIEGKISSAVEKALEPIVSTLQGSVVDRILATKVTDPDKREYVKALYESRIVKTGTSEESIARDLEEAIDLADAKKIKRENSELKRMKDENSVYAPASGGGSGTADRGIERKPHEWTPEQEAALEQRARAIGVDPVKYKERAWKEFQAGTAFAVKPQGK